MNGSGRRSYPMAGFDFSGGQISRVLNTDLDVFVRMLSAIANK